jgi:hypothetical protein
VNFAISDQLPFGPEMNGDNSGSLEVNISPITTPEPTTLFLLGFGGLSLLLRRKQKQV